ncbi:MAG: hypothetical protein HY735_32685 [Verrucomicrobia bacterium]|nr:hypothetical protein [Verrucomicrobiota bacterium]
MNWRDVDWKALVRLRAAYLSGTAGERDYWQSESDLASYDQTFAQRIGWKWDYVLEELKRRGWSPPKGRLFDWGCGSGIAGRAFLDHFEAGGVPALWLWDRSALAMRFAERKARERFPNLIVHAHKRIDEMEAPARSPREQTSNIQHPTSNIEPPASAVSSQFNVQSSMSDVRCSKPSFREPRVRSRRGHEADQVKSEIGAHLLTSAAAVHGPRAHSSRLEAPLEHDPIGTLLLSHVLTELPAAELDRLLTLAVSATAILWIEPGTHEASRALIAVRERLRASFQVVAPCTHQTICGMLAPESAGHWCHHFAPSPPEVFTDGQWARFANLAGLDLRSLPLSFLVLDKRPPPALPPGTVRVIGNPRVYKAEALLLACDAGGVRERHLAKRDLPDEFRQLKKGEFRPLWVWQC